MSRAQRALPWLLPFAALLPNLGAAVPDRTYFFRDLLAAFYPLRLFLARELHEGRWPWWNPYLHEGTFASPTFYPADLLLAIRPSPELFSWLLTLHLPLAALAAYALARQIGCERPGAFTAGVVYALGGFALSSLNLCVFLEALALAPLIMLALRRAAGSGGRAVPLAAAAVAVGVSTLAMEFIGQAIVLGLLLALEARRDGPAVARVFAALLLGLGVAALPIALVVGMLPETQRGPGFDAATAGSNALHPAALLQVLVAGLFGSSEAPPGELFWGGRFFSRGFPYFLSLYLGPAVAALGVAGVARLPRQRRLLLMLPAAFALLFALGDWGGIAPALLSLPGGRAFRFPSKAFFTVHLVSSLLAAAGVDALCRRPWPRSVGILSGGLAAVLLAGSAAAAWRPAWVASAFAVTLGDPAPLGLAVAHECFASGVVAGLLAALALGVARGLVPATRAAALAALVTLLDLSRAGAGLNPQVPASMLELPPGLVAQRLDQLDGQRVFSYEIEQSPSLRAFLLSGAPNRRLGATVMYRRLMNPYTNLLDGVETAWGKDLTSFGGLVPELPPEEYEPRRLSAILPRLRQAAVSRILTLDPLVHPGLELLAEAPAGPLGLRIRVHGLRDPLPRASLACRVVVAPGASLAFERAVAPDFDGRVDVALEADAPASCSRGAVRRLSSAPGAEEYEVEADGSGFLLLRDTFARGWAATRDEERVSVWRANGKYKAVPVTQGRQRVRLTYEAPGRLWGTAVSGFACLILIAMLIRPRRAVPGP